MSTPLGFVASAMQNFNQMAMNMANQLTKMQVSMMRNMDNAFNPGNLGLQLPKIGANANLPPPPSPQMVFRPLEIISRSAAIGGSANVEDAETSRKGESVGF